MRRSAAWMRGWQVLVCAWLVGGFAATGLAWTTAIEISASSSSERSTPRIVAGRSGDIYTVYIHKTSPWQIWFRQKSPPGNWGQLQLISSVFSVRPEIAEDSTGRPHVVFAATNTDGKYDLYHTYRNNGVWTGGYVTLSSSVEDQPHLASDEQGRIHMIYARGSVESSVADAVYRVWTNGTWSGETVLGRIENAYYHRPDLAIDTQGRLHACWIDKASGNFYVRYRRFDGSWSATANVGVVTSTDNFFSYPRIGTAVANDVLVVWHNSTASSTVYYNSSTNGGANWSAGLSGGFQGTVLANGHYPSVGMGAGSIHVIHQLAPASNVLTYSRWNNQGWSVWQQSIATDTGWKGWPDIAADAQGFAHAVWDDGVDGGGNRIAYSTTASDVVPPVAPTQFVATPGHNLIQLSWKNPFDPDYAATQIRYSTAAAPATINDGSLLTTRNANPGSNDATTHTGTLNGTRYYYSAFARDVSGLWSGPVQTSAVPYLPPDIDRDTDVDLTDFAFIQNCLSGSAIAQNDPACLPARLDGDADVDGDDLTLFMNCAAGPGVVPPSNCAG